MPFRFQRIFFLSVVLLVAAPGAIGRADAAGPAAGDPGPRENTERLAEVSVTVALEKGAVDVKSTTGPIGLYREYRRGETADFESYKNQIREGVQKEKEAFDHYKAGIRREFIGYVESVSMKAGTELTISGATAVEREGLGDNPARDFMRKWRAESGGKP